MLDLSTLLKYYKREDIQEQLLSNSANRELGTRYLDGHFGKRPDMLQNKADILELAKQGASSFHISEEHWTNPLALSPSLKKDDLEKMRSGWDLVVDIDCPDWDLSRRIAFVIVKILKNHGISSISCKFSGNKGFHIGVPFKAFPKFVQGKQIKSLFPDKVKNIMEYLVYSAETNFSREIIQDLDLKSLASKLKVAENDLLHDVCIKCNTLYTSKSSGKSIFLCDKCGYKLESESLDSYISCPKCKSIAKRSHGSLNVKKCLRCGAINSIARKINLKLVLGLDNILISPRHLYRMAYSLHEKSSLVSLPINPFTVLAFEKDQALPDKVIPKFKFLDDSNTLEGEASEFLLKALDFKGKDIVYEHSDFSNNMTKLAQKEKMFNADDLERVQEKIPLELFPPSILNILKGLKDGKKRALFVLVNFLTCVGWDYPEIEVLLNEWNSKNTEPLRERFIKSQISYHKLQKKKILPPNYSNKAYYADLGVITSEEEAGKFKNPVNYAKMKALYLNRQTKRKRKDTKNPQEQKVVPKVVQRTQEVNNEEESDE